MSAEYMPFPEQLELVRTLRKHESEHPRQSISGKQDVIDTAIVIPYGYFLSLENLWWVRVLDREGKNDACKRYHNLMRNAIEAIHQAMDMGKDFDITVDDGREIKGYRNITRIDDEK